MSKIRIGEGGLREEGRRVEREGENKQLRDKTERKMCVKVRKVRIGIH